MADRIDLEAVRAQFPGLASGAAFFDNPAGTQISRPALSRIERYLVHTNANANGAFRTSRENDAMVAETRRALADFLGSADPREIVLGPNMTTLTLHLSRSLARTLASGDEIIVTRLDHDANVAPWLLIAEDRGCRVRWVDIDPEECTLEMAGLERQLNRRTRIVAVGLASNAVGTINDVARIAHLAHEAGALCFVDAVQYAPHRTIDVRALGCDFLVCSAYKFFGPHVGILWGRHELLQSLTAYKIRPASADAPRKFETGTQSFETVAGVLGALEYLAWLGERSLPEGDGAAHALGNRGAVLRAGMQAIARHEVALSAALLSRLSGVPGLRLRGITDPRRLAERVPTFSFTLDGWHPRQVAECLAEAGIYVWDGNNAALEIMLRLGLEEHGGMVRVGAVHYNTVAEVDRLAEALHALARRRADHFYRFSTNTLVPASERDRISSVGDALTLERTNG
jgi:cysteine desulfurase family protein (TIGR01976 family)